MDDGYPHGCSKMPDALSPCRTRLYGFVRCMTILKKKAKAGAYRSLLDTAVSSQAMACNGYATKITRVAIGGLPQ